ncbi:MAG: ester cyclase [Gemmatimonadaceae bacterium]
MSLRPLVVGLPLVLLIGCTAKEQQTAAAGASAKPVVEAYVDAWNRHDSAAFDSLMAPDGTHEDIALGFIGKGPAGARQFLDAVLSMEPDFAWKISNVVEQGPMVAAQWTWTATYTGPDPMGRQVKNVHVSGRGTAVVEVENGKISKLTDYYDVASFFPKPDTTKKRPN